jgi:osmotically-inducible protein OsmY
MPFVQPRTPDIRQTAQDLLRHGSYPALRRIVCECNQGVLVLRGRVSSFYQKQLAQEGVAHIEGVVRVVNEIEVED